MRRRLVEQRAEPIEERARPRHVTRVEQREEELGVVGLDLGELLDLPHLVPDDHPEVPERVEEGAEEPFLARGNAAAEEHEQIDIRVQAEMAPPVAAERDDRHRTVRGDGLDEQLPQQRVHAVGVPLQRRATARPTRDVAAELVAGGVERRAKRGSGGRRPACG